MAAPTCWLADGPGHLAMVSVLNFYYLNLLSIVLKVRSHVKASRVAQLTEFADW